jgi:transcriptional regulator with GAF, ATPase, and Fis domain
MYNQLSGLVEVPICFLGLFDESLQTVHVVWQVHEGVELPGGSFPVGSGFTSRVIQTRQPLLIRRWSGHDPRVQLEYATDRPGLPESSCTVPLLFHERVLGVVSIQSYCPEAFNEQHLTLLQAVVNQAAVKLARLAVEWLVSERRDTDADATLASVSHAVLVLDKHGKIVHVNSAARQLLCGADASIVLGEPLDRIGGHQSSHGLPELIDELRPLVALLKKGGVPPVLEVEARADQRTFLSRHSRCCRSTALLSAV